MLKNRLLGALACAAGLLACTGVAAASGNPCEFATTVGLGSHNLTVPCQGGETIELPGDCASSAHNVWFSFTATAAGTYIIDTNGTPDVDTVLKVFSSCFDPVDNRIACDDDSGDSEGNSLTSLVKLKLTAGQTIKIAVGAYFFSEEESPSDADCGPAVLNIRLGADGCEDALWFNGDYDGTGAQTSQVGYDQHWDRFSRVSADDFYLCDGAVYRIRELRGVLCTDAVIPKAQVAIVADCNGDPDVESVFAYADSVRPPQEMIDRYGECAIGEVTIEETGLVNADGFRILNVTARFNQVWLRGGAYHVVFVGYSGTANPLEQFFWGFAGNGVVKGRPGLFRDFEDEHGGWIETSSLCCGCTDFAFGVYGTACKVLLDQLPSIRQLTAPVGAALAAPGVPSLQNGTNTATKVRAADDFVVPPCRDLRLCYIDALLYSNCDRVKLEIYDNDCKKPTGDPIFSAEAACVSKLGQINDGHGVLNVLRAEFYDFKAPRLIAGRQYWLSVFALGENRQNARSYFAYSFRCDHRCFNFNPACVKGPPFATEPWRTANGGFMVGSPGFDLAMTVAVMANDRAPEVIVPACPADQNGDHTVTIQDLFDFLAAWFAGCP